MKKKRVSGSKKPAQKVRSKSGTQVRNAVPKSSVGITPLNDKVVVRPLSPEEAGLRSASGIIIPETIDREKSEQGIVVAVGPGKWNEDGDARMALSVAVGDRILFSKYGFDEVTVGGKEYYIIGEPSILAILET